jgi:SagB-type dehydrogenase family enzyme
MEVLKDRQTTRSFSEKRLPAQVLSNLLWAANGVNRPDSGKRTAPSAMNAQEIDIYVATAEGLHLFEAKEHRLRTILREDIRAQTGGQPFAKQAPVSLVYVADFEKMTKCTDAQRVFYSATDTGFVSQNVYLFCASEGLGTVVHDGVDRASLAPRMKLRPDQKIILAQCVGYPESSGDQGTR